jgi:hypothetical protein
MSFYWATSVDFLRIVSAFPRTMEATAPDIPILAAAKAEYAKLK